MVAQPALVRHRAILDGHRPGSSHPNPREARRIRDAGGGQACRRIGDGDGPGKHPGPDLDAGSGLEFAAATWAS